MTPPTCWNQIRLSEVADIRYGKATPNEQGNVPVVGSGGIFASTSKPLTKEPTLVIGRKGTAGKVWLMEQPCWPSDTTFYLEWRSDLIEARFLSYFFEHNPLSGEHARTTMPSLQRDVLENYVLPVPPVTGQRAIARALDAVQKAKEARQRELALERERKAALMEHLFTYGTRGEATKQTEIGIIPESWKTLCLEDVAAIERGKFAHRPRNAPEFYGGNIPFIQTGDVANSNGHIRTHSQTLNERGLSISRIFPKGTIVITIAANIGFTAILDFDSAFPDSLIGITPKDDVLREYLNYYLVTQQPEMDRKAPRGTQKNINIEFLKPWPIVVPPLEEQVIITEVLRGCDVKIECLQRETSLLEELFCAMLEDLMTGRLSTVPLIEEHQPQ